MTRRAGAGDFVLFGHCGRYEFEGVAPDKIVRQCLFDFRHMAGEAIVSGASRLVMSVSLNARRVGTVRRTWAMALQTHQASRLDQVCVVLRTVNVVARITGDAATIHDGLDEIVSLHTIFMGGAVGKMRERGFAELVIFKLPVVLKMLSHLETDRPIVRFPLRGRSEGASL